MKYLAISKVKLRSGLPKKENDCCMLRKLKKHT